MKVEQFGSVQTMVVTGIKTQTAHGRNGKAKSNISLLCESFLITYLEEQFFCRETNIHVGYAIRIVWRGVYGRPITELGARKIDA